MKAVIYSRVSTRAQAEDGSSLESQERICRKVAIERGYEVYRVFQEDYPGDTLDRPKLAQLREMVRRDHINAVICHATDRLARNPIHLAIIAEECQKNGVELIFVTEPLDNSPEGQLIQYVKGFAAQIEREKIRERTLRGKYMRAIQGKIPQGTGRGAYGYKYNPDTGKRSIIDIEAEIVRRIFRMAIEGYSIHGIANQLNNDRIPSFGGNRWHPLTVRRMLGNPIYEGMTYYGRTKRIPLGGRKSRIEDRDQSEWTLVPDATPAIVSIDIFNVAQQELKKLKSRSGKAIVPYLLSGHIECGYCGSTMSGSLLNRKYRYYYCRKTHPDYAIPHKCEARYVRADPLEQEIWLKLTELLRNPELVVAELQRRREQAVPFLTTDITKVKREIESCKNQQRRLVKLYQFGEIDDEIVVGQTKLLNNKERDFLEELARLQHYQSSIKEIENVDEKILEYCRRVSRNLESLTFDEKRLLFNALQVKVIAYRDHSELRGAIPSYVTIARTSA